MVINNVGAMSFASEMGNKSCPRLANTARLLQSQGLDKRKAGRGPGGNTKEGKRGRSVQFTADNTGMRAALELQHYLLTGARLSLPNNYRGC